MHFLAVHWSVSLSSELCSSELAQSLLGILQQLGDWQVGTLVTVSVLLLVMFMRQARALFRYTQKAVVVEAIDPTWPISPCSPVW